MPTKTLTRPPTKRNLIEQTLRREIIEGRIRPGGRLPSWLELERRFATGPLTVQQAVDSLSRDGFVVARGQRGTFVADHPPHLSRYALVFLHAPDHSRFLTALWKESLTVGRESNRRIELYDSVENHTDNENYQRLLEAVRDERLAGIIFAHVPTELLTTPLVESPPSLSRVAITTAGLIPSVGQVELDIYSYMNQVLDYFASRGRKRLAILAHQDYFDRYGAFLTRGATERGILLRSYWMQLPSGYSALATRNCIELLLNANQIERPDALLLADDNFVENATATLREMDLKIPQDLDVAAHCNFPWPPTTYVPVKWVGFDAKQILEAAIELVDRQRENGNATSSIGVPAVMRDQPIAPTASLAASTFT